jgi:hypothetical protein
MAALSAAIILVAALPVAWPATTIRLPLLGMPLEEYLASAPQVPTVDYAWPYRLVATRDAGELVEWAIFGPAFDPGASEGGLVLCVFITGQAFGDRSPEKAIVDQLSQIYGFRSDSFRRDGVSLHVWRGLDLLNDEELFGYMREASGMSFAVVVDILTYIYEVQVDEGMDTQLVAGAWDDRHDEFFLAQVSFACFPPRSCAEGEPVACRLPETGPQP